MCLGWITTFELIYQIDDEALSQRFDSWSENASLNSQVQFTELEAILCSSQLNPDRNPITKTTKYDRVDILNVPSLRKLAVNLLANLYPV